METRIITGPFSFHLRSLHGKLIFLFSECHAPSIPSNDKSIRLQEYLDTFFQTSEYQSDLFLETSKFTHIPMFEHCRAGRSNIYDGIAEDSSLSELGRIGLYYWDCLGPIKETSAKYGRVRLHNLEFRRPHQFHPALNYELLIVSDDAAFIRLNGFKIGSKLHLCPLLLSAMMDGNMQEVSRLFLQLYADFPEYLPAYEYETMIKYSGYDRLSQQFSKIPFREKLQQDLVHRMQDLVNFPMEEDRLHDRVSAISDLFNDAYTIGRLIKSIYCYPDSKLIWVYAGYAHIYVLEQILSYIYGAVPILDIMPSMEHPTYILLSSEDPIQAEINKLTK